MKEFLPLHIKEVDSTSRTWPSVTFWIIKDKGHASLDSNILRKTKDRQTGAVSYVSGQWRGYDIKGQQAATNTYHNQTEREPDVIERNHLNYSHHACNMELES